VVTAAGCELLGSAVERSVFVVDGAGSAIPVT
jgi:hypothetical protein